MAIRRGVLPIEFTVTGTPRPQPRPRAFYRKGMPGARVYEAGTAEEWKSLIAVAAKPHIPKPPLEGPVVVELYFFMLRPKSHYGTGRNAGTLKSWAHPFHGQRPDGENCEKAVLDALTQLAFWKDDGQVAVMIRHKQWSSSHQGMRIRISKEFPGVVDFELAGKGG